MRSWVLCLRNSRLKAWVVEPGVEKLESGDASMSKVTNYAGRVGLGISPGELGRLKRDGARVSKHPLTSGHFERNRHLVLGRVVR